MKIEKNLPFEICENCEHFILHVQEETLLADGHSFLQLTVKCKNEWLCKQLKDKVKENGSESTM